MTDSLIRGDLPMSSTVPTNDDRPTLRTRIAGAVSEADVQCGHCLLSEGADHQALAAAVLAMPEMQAIRRSLWLFGQTIDGGQHSVSTVLSRAGLQDDVIDWVIES